MSLILTRTSKLKVKKPRKQIVKKVQTRTIREISAEKRVRLLEKRDVIKVDSALTELFNWMFGILKNLDIIIVNLQELNN
jgi:hypothetical protein